MRDFRCEDLYRHRVLGAPVASPSHRRVVLAVTRARRGSDDYGSALWLLDLADADAAPRRITTAAFDAGSPRLDPAGTRVAFLSRRGDAGTQVHVLDLRGGEAQPLTQDTAPTAIEDWSGDGTRLLVTAAVPIDPAAGDGDAAARRCSHDSGAGVPWVARHLPWKKDGSGPVVGARTQLFAVALADGRRVPLVQGDFDVGRARWSPDGGRLAFLRSRGGRERIAMDLWLADADGGHARQRTGALATLQALAWSPDGRRIALVGGAAPGDPTIRLWLLEADGAAAPHRLGDADLELTPESPVLWHPDGQRVAVIAARRGLQQVAIVDVASGTTGFLELGLRHVLGLAASGDRLVASIASLRWPDEVHSLRWDGGDARRHSAFNRRWCARRARPRVLRRRFAVPDGAGGRERIDAWLLLPPHASPPYPLLVDFHGGPHSHVLVDFAMHAYWYPLLARGWAVLAPNAVGSGGYGAAFARRLRGHWGERDFPQHLAILDALQADGLVDERLACTGKSYGGFLAAWAVARSTRFRAAIVAAPVANLESHAGTSDTGIWAASFAMGGANDDDLAAVRTRSADLSPVRHCAGATTATLLLQGERDGRCPLGQAEELFAALIAQSRAPVELVVYPGAGHGLAESGRPSHRLDYHQRLCDWAVRWAGDTPA